jgi:solute carrier family 30 (zinc transporter), member 2
MQKTETSETQNESPVENPKTYNLSILEEKRTTSVRGKLSLVIIVCLLFMSVEVVGGYVAHSIAIMSDAAHLLSDLLGFIISLIAVWLTSLPANEKHSYGYHRAGVIGALASIVLIWSLVAFLVYFAIERVMNLDEVEVDGGLMFYVSLFGLFANLVMAKVLHGSHDHSHGEDGHSHDHEHGHDEHGDEHNPLIGNGTEVHNDDHDHEHEHENTQDKTHNHDHDHKHEHDENKHHHDHDKVFLCLMVQFLA